MLERDVERKVCEYAKSKGVLQYKFVSPNYRSVPDRIFLWKGQVWFIEFKRSDGGKCTEGQLREHERLRAAGFHVFVVSDVEVGKGIIDALTQ